MNKWRLLLFSVFGLLQITTSDRNFIDGRDRCCHNSLPDAKSDKRISLYEPFRVYSLLPELRQLKSPERSRRDRELEYRRSSYRPLINYREEHWRDSTSRRDENRRAIDHQHIRDIEFLDILRARTNRLKISTIALRDSYRQNEARIERSENRNVRLYPRETFQRNAREDFNIRRGSFERKGKVPTRFTGRDTMNTDTVSAQNRNNRENARQIIFVRDDHKDLERRAQYFARTEVTDEMRNALNNLEERVSRLRTRRNSLKDEPHQTKEFRSRFRATHAYDNMATRNNIRIVRDSRNKESLNGNLRALRESHTQTERNSRLIKRSISDEMVRDESSPMNNREHRDILRQKSSRVSETNRDIRLGRQNEEENIHEYTHSRSNKGDFGRLTRNNLNIRRNNDENLFERDTRMMRVSDQNVRYTLRNDNNNRDNKRQVLRERNGQRNQIVKHININHRDASNIIERHIQIDGSRHNIRDFRDIRSERYTEQRTVRNDNEQRRGSGRAQAIDETRIRSNNRANIYHNQGDNINEVVQRSRSQRLINSQQTERSRIEERSTRQTAQDTPLDRNNVNDVAQVLQRRRARSMQERIAIKLDNRDVSEYERRSRNSQERYKSVIQDSRSNSDEETQRIRPQTLGGRNLVQQSIRRLNIRDTSDNYLHRIRSRSLEEKFSITPERNQIRNRDIRNNKILRERKSRHVHKRSTKTQTADKSSILSTSLPISNDVQNVEEEFRRMRSQDKQERTNGQRVTDFRSINVDIRDEVLPNRRFRIMQDRLNNNRNRQETEIRINNVREVLDDEHIRNNKESRQRPRTAEERRSSKSRNMIVIVRTVDEEARRIRSRNQETIARQIMGKSIRITNVPNNRNIDVDSNRMRSRNIQERANRDEPRVVVERSASKSTETRTIRNNDEDHHTRPATERYTDIRRAENIREKRQFNEDNQRTDMRRKITLARENRSRTIYRDTDNKQSASSIFDMKWQYLFYAMQGIYLCSFFIKISKDKESEKKPRMNNWLTPMDMKID